MFHQSTPKPKRFTIFLMLVTLLLGLVAAACAAAAPTPGYSSAPSGGAAPSVAEAPRESQQGGGVNSPSTQPGQGAERLVVKNANLTLVVADPPKAMDNISGLASELGGFVVTANLDHRPLEGGGEAPHATITIRVPAEGLNDALARIRAESDRLPLSENLNSQDVTKEYTDLQSQLRNLEATEAQLTKIMDQATKTEDVLAVYNQLVAIRGQIEQTKGQIQYYSESAALSSISTELIANEAVQPVTIGGWQPGGVAKDAVQALVNTMKFMVNALIWVAIYILPVLLVLFVLVYLPLRWIWRALRRKRTVTPPPAPMEPPALP